MVWNKIKKEQHMNGWKYDEKKRIISALENLSLFLVKQVFQHRIRRNTLHKVEKWFLEKNSIKNDILHTGCGNEPEKKRNFERKA